MQPRRALREPGGGVGPHPGGAALAHLGRGEGVDGWVEAGVLAGDVGVKLGGAMPEQHDSGRLDERSVALEQPARAVAREDREVHVGRLAGWRALAVEEIRVPVHEPEAAAAGQCLEDAEQERAVTAEDEGTLASLQHLAHTGGDRLRRPAHLGRAHHARIGVASRIADARVGLSRVARAEALDQSGRAERGGRVFLAASCPRAVNRGVDDGQASHSSILAGSLPSRVRI